jgi:hypothetical protein
MALAATGLGCGARADSASATTVPEASDLDVMRFDSAPDRAPSSDAADGGDALVVRPAQFTEETMPMRMLVERDPVDLWSAPQGGHVVLIGAKVQNLMSDTANLKVRFRRPDTGLIVAEEGRTVKMVPVPGEPGLMQPDIRTRSQVSNVPLCPSYGPLGIVDELFDMEVQVTALYTDPVQIGQTTIQVIARCSTPDDEAFCRCECEPGYVLGKCSDAGGREASVPDGSPRGDGGEPETD